MKLEKPYFYLITLIRLENSAGSGGGINKGESLFGVGKRIGFAFCIVSCMEINGQIFKL
jgi:hypothetical protein